MENLEYKKEMALAKIKNRLKLIELLFVMNLIFSMISVFHCIWYTNKTSLRLFISSVVLSLVILVAYYLHKEVKKQIENLKQ